jgi:hypothetical protein
LEDQPALASNASALPTTGISIPSFIQPTPLFARCRCPPAPRLSRLFGSSSFSLSCRSRHTPWRPALTVHSSRLRYAQLEGVFLSITPGDPSLWVGVIFVRKGRVFHRAKRGRALFAFPDGCVFTFDRTICACSPTIPNIVSTQLSYFTTPRNLFHGCLSPAAHATHHVHLHDWFLRHRYCQCNRRGATTARRIQSAARLPALVRTSSKIGTQLSRCERVRCRQSWPEHNSRTF